MSYELATQRACDAYYGDPQATPGPIIQAVMALLATMLASCPPATAKKTVQSRPVITRLRMLATSYRMTLPAGVDRNELVDLAMVLAAQSTEAEYATFQAEVPNDTIKAMIPN